MDPLYLLLSVANSRRERFASETVKEGQEPLTTTPLAGSTVIDLTRLVSFRKGLRIEVERTEFRMLSEREVHL